MALFQVGIDVSRYQGSINWSAVAAAGKPFAIVRIVSLASIVTYVEKNKQKKKKRNKTNRILDGDD